MAKIIIVGAGAAGMMAAISAAENGHSVTVFEKNEKPGKKIYIPWNCQEKVTSCRVKIFNDYVSAKPACFVPPQHEEDEKVTLEKITLQAFNGAKLTFRSSEILLPLPN